MARVAFIGLGRMGSGMAARLLAAGHELVVFNRTPEKAQRLVNAGARRADSPREAAQDVDAAVVMVSDDEASRAVWLANDGVLAADLKPGAFAIECSTLSHDWVLELAAATRAQRLRFLDCPVTGLPDAAAAGTLTLLIGADPDDLAAAEPLLQPLATDWLRFGAPGAGTAYKLIINLMGAVQIAATAEGIALAERAGLDVQQVVQAITSSQAASPQVVRNSRRMAADDHDRDVVFSGRLRHKDALYAMRLVRTLDLGAPFGEAALNGLERLIAAGLGDRNESSIIEVARDARPLLPIACTLGSEDGAQRVEEWRAVVRRSGIGTEREQGAISLRFRDDPQVGEELARLVRAERDCCAFLGWELSRADSGWVVRITGTDDELATLSVGL